jgi:two-component system response regulator PilR (NtrC family)
MAERLVLNLKKVEAVCFGLKFIEMGPRRRAGRFLRLQREGEDMKRRILVVDDELSVREFFEILLKKEGYDVVTALDFPDAVKVMKEQALDLIVTDLQLKVGDGMGLLKEARVHCPDVPVIMITAYATTDSAVEAMKAGAFDYLSKPFKIEEIKVVIQKALDTRNLATENQQLKTQLVQRYDFTNFIGESEPMRRVYDLIKKTAPTKTNVLIYGESGTGKELVARAIHFNSTRKDKPFVTVNCGAIPQNLIESELFGHVRGAFTGAVASKEGLFEAAHKGTIFLDEIGELPLVMQVKLLRVIQEKSFLRVGSTESVEVDVRIIAATNRNLEDEVKQGNFREDLFYRLNVIQITLPPLRQRKGDIPVLADYFLKKYARETGKDVRRISPKALEYLSNYEFLGNVRELENIIERSVALESTQEVQVDSLPGNVLNPEQHKDRLSLKEAEKQFEAGGMALDNLVDAFEKDLLVKALDKSHGSRTKAARFLGISSRSMRYRLKKHGIGGYGDLDYDLLDALDEASEEVSKERLAELKAMKLRDSGGSGERKA